MSTRLPDSDEQFDLLAPIELLGAEARLDARPETA